MLRFEHPRYLGLYAHTFRLCPYTGKTLIVSVTGPAALVSRFWIDATSLPADARKVRKAKGDDSGPITKLIDPRTIEKAEVAIPVDLSAEDPEEEAARTRAREALRNRHWYYSVGIHNLRAKVTSRVNFEATRPNPTYANEVETAKANGRPDTWIERHIRKTETYRVSPKQDHITCLLVGFRRFESTVPGIPGWSRITLVHPFLAAQQTLPYDDHRPIGGITLDVARLRAQQNLKVPFTPEEIESKGLASGLIVPAIGYGDPFYSVHGDTKRWLDVAQETD